jgi:hypothetical protein
MDKPHLVLHWTFDVPNNNLFCKIGDDLKYIAYEGGTLPFTKIHKGVTTTVSVQEWLSTERHWISEHYGDLVGYFQPDSSRVITHPKYNRPDHCPNGLGPDGRYLDHLQRMQIVMEGEDMSIIWGGGKDPLFLTPDQGKTIYKRVPTRDVHYPEVITNPNTWWSEWPQACAMQPRTTGPRLSNYAEMAEAGVSSNMIKKCQEGKWPAPLHPELQQWYIYPTA